MRRFFIALMRKEIQGGRTVLYAIKTIIRLAFDEP
jgi:hypothetical protein